MKKITVNGEEFELEDEALCVIVDSGLRLEAPEFTEINGMNTLKCCDGLCEGKATHILTGPFIKDLFHMVFVEGRGVSLPQSREELLAAGFDVQHIVGMIILTFEAIIERGESVFYRDPETHLHPHEVRHLMTLINEFRKFKD